MKKVMIIGADFTPSSYPPALRIRFFVNHLPEFGWQPIIVTTDPQYYEWSVDLENEKLLSGELEVVRTPALSANLTRRFGIGDLGIRSLWYHWQAVRELCKQRQIDLVFIAVPPFVTMVLGRLVYETFGIPYVMDYIDPWVTDYWKSLPPEKRLPKRRLADLLARTLEPIALRHVGHVVAVDIAYTTGVVKRYDWLTEANTTGIPYGGEPADFDYLRHNPRDNRLFDRGDGCFHISYVGRGGADMELTIRATFRAVARGLTRSPELFGRLRFHFVGTSYAPDGMAQPTVLPVAQEIGIQDQVAEQPTRVPYLDALQILLDSDALLVVGSDTEHYTASKIFPYILARRPLLAIFHEASSVVSILRETQAADPITFNDRLSVEHVNQISQRLEDIQERAADCQPSTCWAVFESYTARAMTARLAHVFDRVYAKARS